MNFQIELGDAVAELRGEWAEDEEELSMLPDDVQRWEKGGLKMVLRDLFLARDDYCELSLIFAMHANVCLGVRPQTR